jgi:hypothetical protein
MKSPARVATNLRQSQYLDIKVDVAFTLVGVQFEADSSLRNYRGIVGHGMSADIRINVALDVRNGTQRGCRVQHLK